MLKFFSEEIEFKVPQVTKTSKWLKTISQLNGYKIGELNYIFCSDDYLLEVNKQYLEHDYYTDILTFDNSEEDTKLEGDIFVSIDRVRDNASTLDIGFESEFRRVLIHGMLHLMGYEDSTDELKLRMRAKEDECLQLY
jgi:probable rRNA maturation factor